MTWVSLVGLQPSAVAVTLKTWMAVGGLPARVVLLATPRVEETAKRIADYVRTLAAEVPCRIELVEAVAARQRPSDILVRLSGDGPLTFFGDPGLKAHVVEAVRALPETAVVLHADTDHLYKYQIARPWEREHTRLVNLGLDELLNLYALSVEDADRRSDFLAQFLQRNGLQVPRGVRSSIRVVGFDGPPLDVAFEARGRLYGLVVIDSGDELRRSRDLERFQKLRLKANLTVLTPLEHVARRAVLAGHRVIRSTTTASARRLDSWLRGDFLAFDAPAHGGQPPAPAVGQAHGRGGDGGNLVTCLGTDPSPTLMSLCTHRPTRAWILYDRTTPKVVEAARRLQRFSRRLPTGSIDFVETDRLGLAIDAAGFRGEFPGGPIRVDITPGTKGQASALARLPNADLWSLQGDVPAAVSLDAARSMPLRAPDLLTQAQIVGGPLINPGWARERVAPNKAFLDLLAQFLVAWIRETPSRERRLDAVHNMACSGGEVLVSPMGVRVRFDGKEAMSKGEFLTEGGYWLELVVARRCMAAGADEVRGGVKWAWQDGGVRDEVDVLARFGHLYFVMSCKAGRVQTLLRPTREIEAVALRTMGRFAVPVLVRPVATTHAMARTAQEEPRAAVLSLASLQHPDALRAMLLAAARDRRTTAL
jgi:hypothetical protein